VFSMAGHHHGAVVAPLQDALAGVEPKSAALLIGVAGIAAASEHRPDSLFEEFARIRRLRFSLAGCPGDGQQETEGKEGQGRTQPVTMPGKSIESRHFSSHSITRIAWPRVSTGCERGPESAAALPGLQHALLQQS